MYRNPPLLVFFWTKWLQQNKPPVNCLLEDIKSFRKLIDERSASGMLLCLYTAVPDVMTAWAMNDLANQKQSLGRLLRRLRRLAADPDLEKEFFEQDSDSELDSGSDESLPKGKKEFPKMKAYSQGVWSW